MQRLTLTVLLIYWTVFLWTPSTTGETKPPPAVPVSGRAILTETTVQKQVYSMVYSIIIDKSDHTLYLYCDNKLRNWFPVGTGRRPSYTPTGVFKIINKAKYPTYEGIPGGSPKNPLGVRWLGLNKVSENNKRYGIHGNNNPKSIGRNSSGGCIRMYNQDAIFLYNLVPVGTRVAIRE